MSSLFFMADCHMSYGYQEGGYALYASNYLIWFDSSSSWYTVYGMTSVFLKFHNNGANVLLADGHVAFSSPVEFQAFNW
jgi:prepilin-type processing-associated H-X9-DG protein